MGSGKGKARRAGATVSDSAALPTRLYHLAPRSRRDQILSEGLRPDFGGADGFATGDTPLPAAAPRVGVYLATTPGNIGLQNQSPELDGDFDLWEVDANGLDLQPDFPALYEHGAYAEEDCLWFDEGLSEATDALHESYGEEISYETALNDPFPFISLTGTALSPEAIPAKRLRLLSQRN